MAGSLEQVDTTTAINLGPLNKGAEEQMRLAFNEAFADYPVPFRLGPLEFERKFIQKLNMDFSSSVGAIHDDRLVGFIFTSLGAYRGKTTAYNGGTGVVPNHRGNGLTKRMFEHLLPTLRNHDVERSALEVLEGNSKAIHIYEDLGFKIDRHLKCYKLNPIHLSLGDVNDRIQVEEVQRPDWKLYISMGKLQPSYMDSNWVIDRNLRSHCTLHASMGDETLGYCVFEPLSGRVNQIGVRGSHRGIGVGKALIREVYHRTQQKSLTILNIGEESESLPLFLTSIGFDNQLNQLEMMLDL